MNSKGSGSSRNSPLLSGKSGGNGTRSRGRDHNNSEGEEIEESGLSDEEEETLETASTGTRGSRRKIMTRAREEEEGDEDTSEDDEELTDNEDDDDDDEEGEDSSDMDGQECEKRRGEYAEDITDLEKQFAILREQLYRERIAQIETKLEEVREGKAPEYLQPLEELQVNMMNRIETRTVLRELRLENINCKFQAENVATDQNFQSEKELLWDSLKDDLDEKIHMLEEDKHNLDFTNGLWEVRSGKSRKRKADPMDPDKRKKPVTVIGPHIIYMLKEADILDDWATIKKSLSQRKKA